jgi:hypothetical protein
LHTHSKNISYYFTENKIQKEGGPRAISITVNAPLSSVVYNIKITKTNSQVGVQPICCDLKSHPHIEKTKLEEQRSEKRTKGNDLACFS